MTLRPSHPAAAQPVPQSSRRQRAHAAWDQRLQTALRLDEPGEGVPEAWFLGPRAENADLLRELVLAAIDSHAAFRTGFHLEDPTHITPAIRSSAASRPAPTACGGTRTRCSTRCACPRRSPPCATRGTCSGTLRCRRRSG